MANLRDEIEAYADSLGFPKDPNVYAGTIMGELRAIIARYPRLEAKTVRVRVAVAVSEDGTVIAHGDSRYDDSRLLDEVEFCEGHDRLTWLIADVPLPEEPKTVVAEIEVGRG